MLLQMDHATILSSVFMEVDHKSNGRRFCMIIKVMGEGSLSPFVRCSPDPECCHTDGRWMVFAHWGGRALSPTCYVTWIPGLLHCGTATCLCSKVACCPEPSQSVVRLSGRKNSQAPIHPWPLGIHLSEAAYQMHGFITLVVSFS